MSSTERSTATGKNSPGVLHRGFMVATQAIDHRIGWDKLPKPLGLLVLIGLRDTLREKNLHDTNAAPAQTCPRSIRIRAPCSPHARGTDYNDLSESRMGMARSGSAAISRSTKRGPKPTNG